MKNTKARLLERALLGGMLWGFAEGTLFFIIPDVLITLILMFSLRRSLICLGGALIGALLGGSVMFAFSSFYPEQATALVHAVPFIREWMFTKVSGDFHAQGAWGMMDGPFSGVPYKIYAVLAPQSISFPAFILFSVAARLWRFLTLMGGALVLRLLLQICLGPEGGDYKFYITHAVVWIMLYTAYWTHGIQG
jgi:hypothetical protein